MKITHYWFKTDKTEKDLRIAVVADLHSRAPDAVISAVEQIRPDAVCIAGDLTEALDGTLDGKNENGFRALRALSAIAPYFMHRAITRSAPRTIACVKSPIRSAVGSILRPKTFVVSKRAVHAFWKIPLQNGRELP